MRTVLQPVRMSMENTYLVSKNYLLGPDCIDSSNNDFETGFSEKKNNSSDSKINQREVAPWWTRQGTGSTVT